MWRLTISQKELVQSVTGDGFYETTSDVKFECDSLCLLLEAVSTLSSIQDNDTNYKIEKVVENAEGNVL